LLSDSRNSVFVVADTFTPNTTSDGAGGLWEPYEAEPQELIARWSYATKKELERLQKEDWPIKTTIVEKPIPPDEDFLPYWKGMVDNWRVSDKTIHGLKIFTWNAPLISTQAYMAKLMAILKQKGVIFINYHIKSIDDFFSTFPFHMDLIVNCLGIATRVIFNDPQVFPIRGVLVHFKPQPQIGIYSFDHCTPNAITYVISREDVCLLGGTSDKKYGEPYTQKAELEEIIQRCVHWVPELLQNGDIMSQMTGFWVGLRPGRKTTRLELDESYKIPIVHCYGHGGSGWTTHWGCADDVAQIVSKFHSRSKV